MRLLCICLTSVTLLQWTSKEVRVIKIFLTLGAQPYDAQHRWCTCIAGTGCRTSAIRKCYHRCYRRPLGGISMGCKAGRLFGVGWGRWERDRNGRRESRLERRSGLGWEWLLPNPIPPPKLLFPTGFLGSGPAKYWAQIQGGSLLPVELDKG